MRSIVVELSAEVKLTLSYAANALLIAIPAYAAWKNWDQPRWDRRVVSMVTVGLGSIFAAEGALGWFEYEKEHGRR